MSKFTCRVCDGVFANKYTLAAHVARNNCGPKLPKVKPRCTACNAILTTTFSLNRHRSTCKEAAKPIEEQSELAHLRQDGAQMREMMAALLGQVANLRAEVAAAAPVTAAPSVHIGDINVTFNIRSYERPDTASVTNSEQFDTAFQEHGRETAVKMVELTYYDPKLPQNHSLGKVTGKNVDTHNGVTVVPTLLTNVANTVLRAMSAAAADAVSKKKLTKDGEPAYVWAEHISAGVDNPEMCKKIVALITSHGTPTK